MKQIMVISIAVLFSTFSFAEHDFSAAEKEFAMRSNSKEGREHIAKAKKLLTPVLEDKKSSDKDKLKAMELLGKLAYYEGELLTPETDTGARDKIFDTCANQAETLSKIEVVSKLDPSKKTKTGEYYYWRSVCLALKAKTASTFAKLGIVGPLKRALSGGLELGDHYEGGGIYRTAAGIHIKSSGRVFGLYDTELALKEIDKAIVIGPTHYNAFLIKAQVLRELGRKDEANDLLKKKVAELKALPEEKYPAGFVPETKEFLRLMEHDIQ